MKVKIPEHIIISRTDNIGDVVLSFPVAGILKSKFPNCKISFLGNSYSRDIIEACEHIDQFLDFKELLNNQEITAIKIIHQQKADAIIHVFPNKKLARLAKEAGIPMRIATTNRLYHWGTCNKLVRLSRKSSPFHEAQLNIKLLAPFGIKESFKLTDIPNYYGLTNIKPLPERFTKLIAKDKFNLILHPKSKGSAREWGLQNFDALIKNLYPEKIKIFVTGTLEEGKEMQKLFKNNPEIVDLTGQLNLSELISFIANADGMIAASTGPLHLAAALKIKTIGLYAPMRPIFPMRWAPLGKNASFIVHEKICFKCKKSKDCECIQSITPLEVKGRLMSII